MVYSLLECNMIKIHKLNNIKEWIKGLGHIKNGARKLLIGQKSEANTGYPCRLTRALSG